MPVAVVIRTDNDRAEVDATLGGPCGECEEKGACALHLGGSTTQTLRVTVENRIGARPGDLVEIELRGHTELKLSLLVWVVPLLGLVLGAVAGVALLASSGLSQDLSALIGAVVGFVAAFSLLRKVDARLAGDESLVPRIRRVLETCSHPALQPEPLEHESP